MCTITLRDRFYDAKIFRWAASETYLCNNRLISKKCGHERIYLHKCLESVIPIAIENREPRDAKLSLKSLAISSREFLKDRVTLIDLRVMIPRLWYAIIIVRLLNPLARLIVLICCVISNFCVIFNKSMNYFVSTSTFIFVRSQDFQFLQLLF